MQAENFWPLILFGTPSLSLAPVGNLGEEWVGKRGSDLVGNSWTPHMRWEPPRRNLQGERMTGYLSIKEWAAKLWVSKKLLAGPICNKMQDMLKPKAKRNWAGSCTIGWWSPQMTCSPPCHMRCHITPHMTTTVSWAPHITLVRAWGNTNNWTSSSLQTWKYKKTVSFENLQNSIGILIWNLLKMLGWFHSPIFSLRTET